MANASVALNRFGLGGRPGDAPGADPKAWLTAQLNRYEAKPAAIAALAPSAQIARELSDYLRQVRVLQRGRRAAGTAQPAEPAPPMPAPMAGPAMSDSMRPKRAPQ